MMKKILGIFVAVTFALVATAVYAQTQAKPVEKPAAPAAEKKVEAAPQAEQPKAQPVATQQVADPKTAASDVCKKKGLVGQALDECVKNELAKVEKKTPEAATAKAETKTAAPAAKPATPAAPAAPKAPEAPKTK